MSTNYKTLIKQIFASFGVDIRRLAPNQIRGIDPFSDIHFLLRGSESPVIFDVGANRGETLAHCLSRFPEAKLIAFEPFTESFHILKDKFRSRENVRIENLALGKSRGESKLNLYTSDKMHSLLELDPDPNNLMKNFESTGSALIKVETIDDFCQENGIKRIDLLKVDTQGFDLNVLIGAKGMLQEKSISTILLEVNFVSMYKEQASFSELHAHLASHGYNLVDFYNHVWKDGRIAWCDACYTRAP